MRRETISHEFPSTRRSDAGADLPTSGRLKRRSARTRPISTGLGWLSIGLGLAELVAPGRLGHRIGMRDDLASRRLLRAMGLREIATGVGILSSRRRWPWLWLRVGGDIVDLALIQRSRMMCTKERARLRMALGAIAGVAAVDAVVAQRSRRSERMIGAGPHARLVKAVVTIRRAPDEVYGFFRELSNLPLFMKHLESVEEQDERISHWVVRGPAGSTFEWDAEIVKERPGEMLSWRSLAGGDIKADGVVRFTLAPGGRGTEVHAKIRYRAPGGRLGAAIAKLFGREPGQQALGDLQRLKQVLETGDLVRSDASIHTGMHAARPSWEPEAYLENPDAQEIGR
jgi:uncharacterized membrane protein